MGFSDNKLPTLGCYKYVLIQAIAGLQIQYSTAEKRPGHANKHTIDTEGKEDRQTESPPFIHAQSLLF